MAERGRGHAATGLVNEKAAHLLQQVSRPVWTWDCVAIRAICATYYSAIPRPGQPDTLPWVSGGFPTTLNTYPSPRGIALREYGGHMTTKAYRNAELFLRNRYPTEGPWDIPIVHDPVNVTPEILRRTRWLPCSFTRRAETPQRKRWGVHHFVGDEHIPDIYRSPEKTFDKYAQYAVLLTPDNSTYREMPHYIQLRSVFESRWVGAFWQSRGLTVIPTVTWGDALSHTFCFCGLEKGTLVAISTIGCKTQFECRTNFMRGFIAMIERVRPRLILCVGTPFIEMYTYKVPIIVAPYKWPGRGVH